LIEIFGNDWPDDNPPVRAALRADGTPTRAAR
jgi:hypothetical protein